MVEINKKCISLDSSANNKRIAKNTLLLYFRMLLTMVVSLNKYYIPEASIIAGQPAKLVKTGIYRDMNDDKINYNEI